MNLDLIKDILIVSMASSIISTATIQKVKERITNKDIIFISSLLISLILGTLFSLSFTELTIINSIWVGLITWIGADAIYKTFEDKIFKSFSNMNSVIKIERSDK